MKRNKVNKTFTMEKESFNIIQKLMLEKEYSSYSAALERIILEWSFFQNCKKIDFDVSKKPSNERGDLETVDIAYDEEADNPIHKSLIEDIFNDMD